MSSLLFFICKALCDVFLYERCYINQVNYYYIISVNRQTFASETFSMWTIFSTHDGAARHPHRGHPVQATVLFLPVWRAREHSVNLSHHA